MTDTANQENNSDSRILATALKRLKAEILHLLGFSFAMNLLLLTVPIFMIQVFDRVLTSQSMETLSVLAMGTIAALLVMAALDVIRGRILVRIAIELEAKLTSAFVQRALVRVCPEVSRLRNFLNGSAFIVCLDAPWVPLFVGITFIIHPLLGWITLIGAAVMLLLAFFSELFSRRNSMLLRHCDETLNRFSSHLLYLGQNDLTSGNGVGIEQTWQSKFDRASTTRVKLQDRIQFFAAAGRFLRLAVQILLISGAAMLVTSGQITAGGMIAASVIAARALGPVERAQDAWRSIIDARASLTRIAHADNKPEAPTRGFPEISPSSLDLVDVTYMPAESAQPVISSVSVNLREGEMLGITGESASGKTTLAKLMAGMMAPTQGRVRMDKQDVVASENDVAFLSPSSRLLPGTVAENISMFSHSKIDDVLAAAKQAGVDEAILDLKEGFETKVEPGDSTLSSSVAQRILLARTYFRQPRLLILDEPYTHLDNAGVTALHGALSDLRDQGVMIVVISQRPSILAQCDKVLIMQDGRGRMAERRKRAELKLLDNAAPSSTKQTIMEAAQ